MSKPKSKELLVLLVRPPFITSLHPSPTSLLDYQIPKEALVRTDYPSPLKRPSELNLSGPTCSLHYQKSNLFGHSLSLGFSLHSLWTSPISSTVYSATWGTSSGKNLSAFTSQTHLNLITTLWHVISSSLFYRKRIWKSNGSSALPKTLDVAGTVFK